MTIATLTIDQVLALPTHQIRELLTKCGKRINEILDTLKSPVGPACGSPEEEKLNSELRRLAELRKVMWSQLHGQVEEGTNVYHQQAA